MEKIVTITASHRPNYTQQVIDSLFNCFGVSSYKLIAFVEPINDEVINIFKKINFCEVELNINPRQLGHTLNAHLSLQRGFELSEYVIHIEDDTILAKDFLKFHEFCSRMFKARNDLVYSVSAGHYSEPSRIYSKEETKLITLRDWFSNQGWATWSDRWFEVGGASEVWENSETIEGSEYRINYRYGGWDTLLQNVHRWERHEVISIVPRVKNIGAEGGIHKVTPEYHKENIEVNDWAENYDLEENATYKLI